MTASASQFESMLAVVVTKSTPTRLAITVAFISATGATDGIYLVDEKDAGLLCPGRPISAGQNGQRFYMKALGFSGIQVRVLCCR